MTLVAVQHLQRGDRFTDMCGDRFRISGTTPWSRTAYAITARSETSERPILPAPWRDNDDGIYIAPGGTLFDVDISGRTSR